MSRAGEERESQACGWWQCLVCLGLRVPTGAWWRVALDRWLVPTLVLTATNAVVAGIWGKVPWLLPHSSK